MATIFGEDGGEMVLVPAGHFLMGSNEREDEAPPHRRYLPAFYIDRHEVTNAQYEKFVAETGMPPPPHWNGSKPPPGTENLPVTNITWFDAMHYAIWAGKRLPTEAEWEKAARGCDGRRYPWGDADDPDRRNIDSGSLEPVGQRLQGASPFGCLDMSGNAWEWTADWYDAYPGASISSLHFGRKYKVIRGGGAIGFYGASNTGRCSERARCLPYGRYDGLGFRCVKDVDPSKRPYDPKKLLREAEAILQHPYPKPAMLSFEKEFSNYLRQRKFPLRIAGSIGQEGYVRLGVPFPRGLLKDAQQIQVVSVQGTPRPTQAKVLVRWEDGSVRWLLLDFMARGGETCLLDFRRTGTQAPKYPLRICQEGNKVMIETGRVRLLITQQGLLEELCLCDGQVLVKRMDIRLRLASTQGCLELHPLPAERLEVEEAGTLHGVVRLDGGFARLDGLPFPFRYNLRIHVFAGSAQIRLLLTLTHLSSRDSEPAALADASVHFTIADVPTQILLGMDRGTLRLPSGKQTELLQMDNLRYEVVQDGQRVAWGTRAPGWLAAKLGSNWCLLGLRHFWQNHPKAIYFTPTSIGIRLWAGEEPFEWEGGLAKGHELVLELSEGPPEQVSLEPLRAAMPPAWACGTKAMGSLLPRSQESIAFFPYWEALLESSMRDWVRGMPTGMRHFGDAYFGGPYKGKNAYANLEYDVPFNFLVQFLRTGQAWYLEAADIQARHQADVDIDHFTGRQWKHSPLHTTTEADLGHVFVRGLLLHFLLTGEQRSLEAAQEVGDWLAPKVASLEGIGNERQIGWSLYALTGLYEVTGDERYLKAAAEAALRLAADQSTTGRFNIRWDNRISFFNGIAMAGFVEVYRHTNSEKIAQAILRLADRTLGFYPEYACRTLNGLAWAAERTKDPRYLNLIERTWETSMDYLMQRDATTASTFSCHFLRFAAKHRLSFSSLFESQGGVFPDPASWRAIRLQGDKVELFLAKRKSKVGAIVVLLEGLTEGQVELFEAKGKQVRKFEFRNPTKPFKALSLSLPKGGTIWRMRLLSRQTVTWELHSDADISITVFDPLFQHIPNLYPRAFGFVKEGTREVMLRLEVIGEGFHRATLYDPDGYPVAAVQQFVDLGDTKCYELELKAPVDGRAKGWALEIYKARILSIEGLLPYWANTLEELFNPEQVQELES